MYVCLCLIIICVYCSSILVRNCYRIDPEQSRDLFNNWCIHESSTVYLKLLRYKLVTMLKKKEKEKKGMIICYTFANMLL